MEYEGTCRLCNEYKPLHNSHIFPEFLYKPLYDATHRAPHLPAGGELITIQEGIKEHLRKLRKAAQPV